MKKHLLGVVISLFCVGAVFAENDIQKTELILRNVYTSPMLFTTYHSLDKNDPDGIASKFEVAGFYNETVDSSELGEVFGANCKNYIVVGTEAQVTAGTADVQNNQLLHYGSATDPGTNSLEAKITFDPKRTVFGTAVNAHITLDKILKGLYFKETIPVFYVKHDLNASYCDSKTGADSTEAHALADILSGKTLVRSKGEDEQLPLTHAKINGSHSRTGIGNMDSVLGWRFLDKDKYFVGINAALQTPSGDRPTGEFLWEPRLGSKHWGLGGGLEAGYRIWKCGKQSLKMFIEGNYRYQFEEDEKRTLGLKNIFTTSPKSKHILSHYYLLAEDKHYVFIPAANVLTQDVDVTPGSNIDGLVAFNYNNGNFSLDLGYNIFWKERESVKLKACSWTDDRYFVPEVAVDAIEDDTPVAFDITEAGDVIAKVNACNIDTTVAETPSILSHTIFAGVGYIFNSWENPLMLGLGGSYEFGDGRASADSWSAWLKVGAAF